MFNPFSASHQLPALARLLLVSIFTLLSAAFAQDEAVAGKAPPPEIRGIRLGMPYAQAHAQLAKIGQMKKEEEGQEVWTLLGDEHYQSLIVGFDRDRKARYVTALADPDGTPLRYSDVGDIAAAARGGQPGNLTFTWKGRDAKEKIEYLAIAKGKDAQRLSSYSVKRLGVPVEDKD
jgi:hypothetical protein